MLQDTDAEFVTVGIVDTLGMLRGKYISRRKFESALRDGMGVPAVTLGLDFHDVMAADAKVGGADTGYYDAHGARDPGVVPGDPVGARAPAAVLPARVRRRDGRDLPAQRAAARPRPGAGAGPRARHRSGVRVHAVQRDERLGGREGSPRPAGGDAALDLLRAPAAVRVGGVLRRLDRRVPLATDRARQPPRGDGAGLHGGHDPVRPCAAGGGRRGGVQELREGRRASPRPAAQLHGALVEPGRRPERPPPPLVSRHRPPRGAARPGRPSTACRRRCCTCSAGCRR